MADLKKKLSTNVAGDFFVDSTGINCDTCRQLALATFQEKGDYSSVYRQPETEPERQDAWRRYSPVRLGPSARLRKIRRICAGRWRAFRCIWRETSTTTGSIPRSR